MTVKTINGTATASIKTVNGTAVAGVKTWNGESYPGGSGGTFKVFSGTYTGTGSALGVTGVGFQPEMLWIKASGSAANDDPVVAWDGLGGASNYAKVISTAAAPTNTGMITSYDADGFTIGTNAIINTNTVTYYYVAITGDSGEFYAGNYTGNATDDRDITDPGFQPDFVFITARAAAALAYRFSSNVGDGSFTGVNTTVQPGRIQSFISTGFQIGTSTINDNAVVYDYFCIKVPSGAGQSDSYTGNGADDRDITLSSGILPTAVFAKGGGTGPILVMRGSANTGDDTSVLSNSIANASNMVQALNTGSFQVGTDANVNTNTTVYYYLAIKSE